MSGIDFARSDLLSPGLLCELVLKDEFTFQITALEIFPKTGGGGHSYIIEDMDVHQGFFKPLPFADPNFGKILDPSGRQLAENFRKYIP